MATNTTLSIAATTPFTTRLGGTNSKHAGGDVQSVGVKYTAYGSSYLPGRKSELEGKNVYLIEGGQNKTRGTTVSDSLKLSADVHFIGVSLTINGKTDGPEVIFHPRLNDTSSRLHDRQLVSLTGHVVQEYGEDGKVSFTMEVKDKYQQTLCEKFSESVVDTGAYAGAQLSRIGNATGQLASGAYSRLPSRASLSERGQQAWGAVSSRLPSWNKSADSKKKQ